jgi:acyl-CoA thioester hydrolase
MAPEGITHETQIRVRYGEVDQMGVVYHGHYLVYFEMGRTELMRSLGATYREVEESGTLLFVVETGLRFLRPAHYDEVLTVRTHLVSIRGVRLRFEYEVWRGTQHLTSGFTILASCDADGRPRRIPVSLSTLMERWAAQEGPASTPIRKVEAAAAVQAPQGAPPPAPPAPAPPATDPPPA